MSKDKKLVKHEHHANSAEEGDTANIKQNTTNGYEFPRPAVGIQSCTVFSKAQQINI